MTLSTRSMDGEEGGVGRQVSPPSGPMGRWGGVVVEDGDERELSDFDAKLALLSRGVAGNIGCHVGAARMDGGVRW